MAEFERRIDNDGRTTQYTMTIKADDRNAHLFDEAAKMVAR
jgi:hypothetical protein